MIGVHALVIRKGQILLVKRANEPSKGKWGIPGGRIELGETIYEAARREVLEECSVEIEIERVLDVGENIIRDEEGRTSYHFVLIYLLARHESGEIKAQSDAEAARWVRLQEMAELDTHPQPKALIMHAGLS